MKDKLMNGFLLFATKIQNQRHINAIKNGFTNLMPIIIVGSVCTLISNVVCNTSEGYVSLANLPGMSWLGSLKPIFDAANYGTMNMMAIGVCILVAMELGSTLGQNDWAIPVTALACYISVVDTSNGLGTSVTAAAGLFVALMVSLVSTEIYCRLTSSGKLSIHMPESVPSNVAKSFSILLPAAITIFVISTFGFAFTAITGMMVPEAIIRFIQTPLSGIMTHPLGILVIAFMCSLLWVFGIHGPNTLNGIYEPIFLAAYAENEAAYAAGLAAHNIVCSPFWSTFFSLTGSGITGGLLIAIFLFSKRDDFRAIAKLALPCGIFNDFWYSHRYEPDLDDPVHDCPAGLCRYRLFPDSHRVLPETGSKRTVDDAAIPVRFPGRRRKHYRGTVTDHRYPCGGGYLHAIRYHAEQPGSARGRVIERAII